MRIQRVKNNYKESEGDCMYCTSNAIKIRMFCTKILIQVDKSNHNCYN